MENACAIITTPISLPEVSLYLIPAYTQLIIFLLLFIVGIAIAVIIWAIVHRRKKGAEVSPDGANAKTGGAVVKIKKRRVLLWSSLGAAALYIVALGVLPDYNYFSFAISALLLVAYVGLMVTYLLALNDSLYRYIGFSVMIIITFFLAVCIDVKYPV